LQLREDFQIFGATGSALGANQRPEVHDQACVAKEGDLLRRAPLVG
jgi:hypothetical protein